MGPDDGAVFRELDHVDLEVAHVGEEVVFRLSAEWLVRRANIDSAEVTAR